jgi:hypothetical protein
VLFLSVESLHCCVNINFHVCDPWRVFRLDSLVNIFEVDF